MNQGCVLAILRLLSHLQNRSPLPQPGSGSTLYRDLIFTQTDPLQPLSKPSDLSTPSSPLSRHVNRSISHTANPFRLPEPNLPPPIDSHHQLPSPPVLSPRHSSLAAFDSRGPPSPPKIRRPLPMHQSLSAEDVSSTAVSPFHSSQLAPPAKLSVNPFRQRSASSNASPSFTTLPNSPAAIHALASPPVPPRPSVSTSHRSNGRPMSAGEDHQPLSQIPPIPSLPPPKHHTQQQHSKLADGSSTGDDQDRARGTTSTSNAHPLESIQETPRPSSPITSPSKSTKPKIAPRLAKPIPIPSRSNTLSSLPSDTSNPIIKHKPVGTSQLGPEILPKPLNGPTGGKLTSNPSALHLFHTPLYVAHCAKYFCCHY